MKLHWEEQQKASLKKVKEALDLSLLCWILWCKQRVNAPSGSLGTELTQEGQPIAYALKALTPTEQKYAQIENLGRMVTIGSQALESIMKKPLHASPLRLQMMLVQPQRYPEISLVYKRGASLHLADALSRAHLEEQLTNAEQLYRYKLSWTYELNPQLPRFVEESIKDEILPELQKVIVSGWPESWGQVPTKLQEFWNDKDELSVCRGLVLKGQTIFRPKRLRGEMQAKIQNGHLGIFKTLIKARDILLWPGMAAEITAGGNQEVHSVSGETAKSAVWTAEVTRDSTTALGWGRKRPSAQERSELSRNRWLLLQVVRTNLA